MAGQGEWRRDPAGRFEFRYWDGLQYTEWVGNRGELLFDSGPIPVGPTTIEVGFGSLERQNRWTVGFRLILAIPHFFWISLVSFAAFFVVIVGWFAALFTARLPVGTERFLTRVLQYHVRLLSYVYLLRDDYPPFALSNTTYPVVAETTPSTLNRIAVLFRLVLMLPVMILASWLGSGLFVAMVVIWIIVLAKGRMPSVVAQAIAAVLRFEARTYGYGMMLASAYPGGLYGDRVEVVTGPASDDTPALPPTEPPRTARLVLSTGARRLVTLFLVVGILQNVASNVFNSRVEDPSNAQVSQVSAQLKR